MTLQLLDEAKEELGESAHRYEEKRSGLGDEFVDAVERALTVIEKRPRQFTRLSVSNPEREIRRCVLKRFPYLIIFEILSEEILVVAIAHGKRKPNYWKDRLS